jgi:hypothetical protein
LLPFIFLTNKIPTFSIFFLDFMMIHVRFSIPWDSRGMAMVSGIPNYQPRSWWQVVESNNSQPKNNPIRYQGWFGVCHH